MNDTNKFTLKDSEGRLWVIESDASYDIIASAIRFLRTINNTRMVELSALMIGYGYTFEAELLVAPVVDFNF